MKARELVRAVYKQKMLCGYREKINALIRSASTKQQQDDLISYGNSLIKTCKDSEMWNICNTKYTKECTGVYAKYYDALISVLPLEKEYIECSKILQKLNQT